MKKLLMMFVILFTPLYLFSQSTEPDNYFSLNFQAGYLFPFSTTGLANSQSFEVRPSIQYKLSKTLTLLLEYNICTQRFYYKNSSSSTSKYLISFGLRIYPQSREHYYIKTALSVPNNIGPHDINLMPGFNLGLGYDFKLSNEFDFFGEAETLSSFSAETTDFSISAGFKYKLF
jgi:hypothetical protein